MTAADKMPPLPDAHILRVLHADRDPGPPYTVSGFEASQMHAYARQYAAQVAWPLVEALEWYAQRLVPAIHPRSPGSCDDGRFARAALATFKESTNG